MPLGETDSGKVQGDAMREKLVQKQRKEIRRQKAEIEFLEARLKGERDRRIKAEHENNRRESSFNIWMRQIVEKYGEVRLNSKGMGVDIRTSVIDNEDGGKTFVIKKAEG
jgi:hypothetical protein